MSVEGHILDDPRLYMNKEFQPVHGVWDTKDKKFFAPAHLLSWAVLNYSTRFITDGVLK